MLARQIRDGVARVTAPPVACASTAACNRYAGIRLLVDGKRAAAIMSVTDVEALARQDAQARAQSARRHALVARPGAGGDWARPELLIARFRAARDRRAARAIVAMTFTARRPPDARTRRRDAARGQRGSTARTYADAPHVALTDGSRARRSRATAAHGWRLDRAAVAAGIAHDRRDGDSAAPTGPLASELGALPRFIERRRAAVQRSGARSARCRAGQRSTLANVPEVARQRRDDGQPADRANACARDRWPMHLFTEDPAALAPMSRRALEWEIGAAIGAVASGCLSRCP